MTTESNPDRLGAVAVNSAGQSRGTPRHLDTAPGLSGLDGNMDSLAWFPFYVNDWLGSATVCKMTLRQIGSYMLLLAWQWQSNECMLDDCPEMLSRIARADITGADMQIVMRKFPVIAPGFRANPKLREIYQEQVRKHNNRVNAGKKRSNAPAMLQQCSSNGGEISDLRSQILDPKTQISDLSDPSEPPPPLKTAIQTLMACKLFPRVAEAGWYNELTTYTSKLPDKILQAVVQAMIADATNATSPIQFPALMLRKRLEKAYETDGLKTWEDEREARKARQRARGRNV